MCAALNQSEIGIDRRGILTKISSGGHRLLIYIVKRNTKADGMGPIKIREESLSINRVKNNTNLNRTKDIMTQNG